MARATKNREFLRRIAVVGDGVTEKIYFEQLKETERLKDVVINRNFLANPPKAVLLKR